MVHQYFGSIDTSSELWRIDGFCVDNFKLDIWIWDAREGDLEWLEKKIKKISKLNQECKKLFTVKYREVFFDALDSWFEYEKGMMIEIFGPHNSVEEITADMVWNAMELRQIDLIREDNSLELSIDYKFKNIDCNYVTNFRFDESGNLVSCGWES